MRSRLYECTVMHQRLAPKRHGFNYRIFMLALDLDELPLLSDRLRLLSVNAPNIYAVREDDYLPLGEPRHNPSIRPMATTPEDSRPWFAGLKGRVAALLCEHGITAPLGRVELITLPRILGYQFNPISLYFCRDAAGDPLAAVAEVTNTFRETKAYVLGPACWSSRGFSVRLPKHFYVSPFSSLDVAFEFRLPVPGQQLHARIDDFEQDRRILASALTGYARPLTDPTLAWFLFKYPLLTLRVILLIHWHALRLFAQKVPWFGKADRPGDQRDVLRPHASLRPQPLKS